MNAMSDTTEKSILEEIDKINQKLSLLEEYAAWMIHSDMRFKVGQRVQFSGKAIENRIGPGKHGVLKGKVVSVGSGFHVTVLLDGYKKPAAYHHSFFNPVSGPKLF